MRSARVRNGLKEGGTYHAMSRFADGKRVFDVRDRACVHAAYFLKLMRKLEAFHEMKVITYTLMSTHFHILVQEPLRPRTEISDEELVAKVRALNGDAAAIELQWQLQHLRRELQSPAAAEAIKARYLTRMGNVSWFIKELKGRFAQWFNKRHGRYGVLWSERFKSVLVEGGTALWTMAAYIDLNCVRAGLTDDPKDYRYCGYAEAIGGSRIARDGLMEVFADRGQTDWRSFARSYRKLLFSEGEQRRAEPGKKARRGIPEEKVKAVLEGSGELTLGELVLCRVRYFAEGLALGSAGFIENIFQKNRGHFGPSRRSGPRKLAGGDYEGLHSLRTLRRQPIV